MEPRVKVYKHSPEYYHPMIPVFFLIEVRCTDKHNRKNYILITIEDISKPAYSLLYQHSLSPSSKDDQSLERLLNLQLERALGEQRYRIASSVSEMKDLVHKSEIINFIYKSDYISSSNLDEYILSEWIDKGIDSMAKNESVPQNLRDIAWDALDVVEIRKKLIESNM